MSRLGNTRAHRSETRDGDADMVVDFEHLLLVRSELRGGALEGGQHGVGLGAKPDAGAAFLPLIF